MSSRKNPQIKTIKALVCDDDSADSIAYVLQQCTYLGKYRFTVEISERESEAIRLIRKKTYDLAFLDTYIIDKFGGLWVADEFRKRFPHAPIIGMSGGDYEAVWKEAGYDYIQKPLRATDVVSILLDYFDQPNSTSKRK